MRQLFKLQALFLVPACIAVLFGACGPSNISGGVIAIDINPVNGVHRCWAAAHMGKEGSKIMAPLSADFDPTPTIVFEVFAGGAGTTFDNMLPSAILNGGTSAMGTVQAAQQHLTSFTSTRSGSPISQTVPTYHRAFSTFALTEPADLFIKALDNVLYHVKETERAAS